MCAQGSHFPVGIITASNQGTDANYGMENVLGKFISHCLANLMVGLAVVSIGGGKASEVRDRFNVPDDEMVRPMRALVQRNRHIKRSPRDHSRRVKGATVRKLVHI